MLNSQVQIFRTAPVARPRRLSYWNEVANTTFGPIAIDFLSSPFSGTLQRRRFGALTLACVYSSPARVQGGRSGVAQSDGCFLLLNETGTSRLRQRGRETCLGPGELTVLRADEPYHLEFTQPNKTLVLHLPERTNRIDLDEHAARRHSVADTPLLIAFLRQLDQAPSEVPNAARLALDLAALTWPRSHRPGRVSLAAWRDRLREHIDVNVSDPQLGAHSIGIELGVSTRFVHMAFASIGQTASTYITERRLALAAQRLRCEPELSITALALDLGFSDLSRFCRVFRRRFNVSAREYRAGL